MGQLGETTDGLVAWLWWVVPSNVGCVRGKAVGGGGVVPRKKKMGGLMDLTVQSKSNRQQNRSLKDGRGHVGGVDGRGGGAGAGGGGAGDGGVPRLRWPPQPGRDAQPRCWRPHHSHPLRAVHPRPATRLLPRLPPPPLPHQRRGDAGARAGGGRGPRAGCGGGGGVHLLAAARHLRHHPGPEPEEVGAGDGPAADRPPRRRQHRRRRRAHRRLHEPRALVRPRAGLRRLDASLGLLGRTPRRRAPRCGALRLPLHGQRRDAPAVAPGVRLAPSPTWTEMSAFGKVPAVGIFAPASCSYGVCIRTTHMYEGSLGICTACV